jgi:hypothetical protein
VLYHKKSYFENERATNKNPLLLYPGNPFLPSEVLTQNAREGIRIRKFRIIAPFSFPCHGEKENIITSDFYCV